MVQQPLTVEIFNKAIEALRADMATKHDLKRVEVKVDAMGIRLDNLHKENMDQHLETRKMIGDLSRKHTVLVEGLLIAAKAAI